MTARAPEGDLADRAPAREAGGWRPVRADGVACAIYLALVVKLYLMSFADDASLLPQGGTAWPLKSLLVHWASHVALLLVLTALPALWIAAPDRQRRTALLIHAVVAALAYFDLLLARYQGFHFYYVQFHLVGEGWSSITTLFSFARAGDLAFLLDLPIIALVWIAAAGTSPALVLDRRLVLALPAVAGAFMAAHVVAIAGRESNPWRWQLDMAASPLAARKLTYPLRWLLNGAFLAMLHPDHHPPPGAPPPGLPPGQPARGGWRPHLLLVQVESMTGGAPDWSIGGAPVMPFVRRLAADGIYFPNGLTTRMSGGSFDADIGVLTGFHPPATSDPYGYAFHAPPYLPHLLERVGYATATYDNHIPEFMNSAANHEALGIRRFFSIRDAEWRTRVERLGVAGPGDREFLAWVAGRVLEAERPGLFFVRTNTSHGPFAGIEREPEIRDTIATTFEGDAVTAGYAAAMRYVDIALEGMIEPLGPLLESGRLIVVIYGDHGSGVAIRDDGLPGLSRADFLLKNVPIVIVGAGVPPAVRPEPVSLQDLAVTLARLIGIGFEAGDLGGRDLLAGGDLPGLVTPFAVFAAGRAHPPEAGEQDLIRYGYEKLGAPR